MAATGKNRKQPAQQQADREAADVTEE